MALSKSASSLDWTPEKFNGFKLRRLIVDGGTQALRNVFQKSHRGKSAQAVLAANAHLLANLKIGSKSKGKKVINQAQWDILYPKPPNIPDIRKFDITLLSILLRNICGLTAPATTGWVTEPDASDQSDEANIVRVRLFRNELDAHVPETGVSTKDFQYYWNKIGPVLVSLGIDRAEIDSLEVEECGEEVIERVMNEWNAMKDDIKEDLETIKMMQQKILEISSKTQSTVEEHGTRLEILEQHQKENKRRRKMKP